MVYMSQPNTLCYLCQPPPELRLLIDTAVAAAAAAETQAVHLASLDLALAPLNDAAATAGTAAVCLVDLDLSLLLTRQAWEHWDRLWDYAGIWKHWVAAMGPIRCCELAVLQ